MIAKFRKPIKPISNGPALAGRVASGCDLVLPGLITARAIRTGKRRVGDIVRNAGWLRPAGDLDPAKRAHIATMPKSSPP